VVLGTKKIIFRAERQKNLKIKSACFLRFFEKNLPLVKKLKIFLKKHLTFLEYQVILCGLSKLGRFQEREH